MSASLVGSEMCIRDRACVALAAKLVAPRSCNRNSSSGGRSISSCCWPIAVSYTHLTLPTICSV
eukprot:8210082-Alexandrium_andersonii.AAC.1